MELSDRIHTTGAAIPLLETVHYQAAIGVGPIEVDLGIFCPMPGQNQYWDKAIHPVPGPRLVIAAHMSNNNAANYIHLYLSSAPVATWQQFHRAVFTVFSPTTSGILVDVNVPAGYGLKVAIENGAAAAAAYFVDVSFYSN